MSITLNADTKHCTEKPGKYDYDAEEDDYLGAIIRIDGTISKRNFIRYHLRVLLIFRGFTDRHLGGMSFFLYTSGRS